MTLGEYTLAVMTVLVALVLMAEGAWQGWVHVGVALFMIAFMFTWLYTAEQERQRLAAVAAKHKKVV